MIDSADSYEPDQKRSRPLTDKAITALMLARVCESSRSGPLFHRLQEPWCIHRTCISIDTDIIQLWLLLLLFCIPFVSGWSRPF